MEEVIRKMYVHTVLMFSRSAIRCMGILFQYVGGYKKDVCAYCFNMMGVINKMYTHTVLILRRSSIRCLCILFQYG